MSVKAQNEEENISVLTINLLQLTELCTECSTCCCSKRDVKSYTTVHQDSINISISI